MKNLPLITLVVTASFVYFTLQQCIYTYPETTSSLSDCSGQILFDNSNPANFPQQWTGSSSTKIFSFDLQIQMPTGTLCSGASGAYLFGVQITTGLGPIALLSFSYDLLSVGPPPSYGFSAYFQDSSGPNILFTVPSTYAPDTYTDYELAGTIDLTYASPSLKAYLAFEEGIKYEEAGPGYDSTWAFDSSTRIFICSDFVGNPTFYCTILAFNYWFTNPTDLIAFTGQLTPSLIAMYLFKEGSGYRISDSGTLGAAYFGDSGPSTIDTANSPQWLSTQAGIQFTSSNQFVTIKIFSLAPTLSQYDMGSLTITFWIQRTRNNGGYIFRLANSDVKTFLSKISHYPSPQLSYDYFSITISNDGFLSAAINSQTATTSTAISSATWTLVTVTYALHLLSRGHYITINIGESSPYSQPVSAIPPFFAIGGPNSFKGSISDFRIYSSGSGAIIDKTSCQDSTITSSCLLSFGRLDSNQCLTITCDSNCLTCFDHTASGCLSCKSGYSLSNSQCISNTPKTTPALSQTTADTIKGSQKSAQAATQVVNAVTAGSPSGVSAAIGGKIFFNIKFLNISYSENLEEALTSWNSNFISLGLTPNLPSSIKSQIPNEDVPYVFDKRGVPSSFLENFWESLGMVLFVALILLGVFLLELTITKFPYRYLPRHLLFAVRAVIQNFLLAQLYSVFGDMLFFATLEFRAPNVHHKWSRLSLAASIILLIFMFFILGLHLNLLCKYQKIRKTNVDLSKFENENKGSNVLFGDFKDISLARQSFLLLLTGRDLLFSVLLTTMYEHPLVECIFILVLNIAMVTYLLLLPPFKSTFDATQQLFYEVVTLAVNVSVLILAIMDEIDSPDNPGFRSQIGRFIIIVNMVFNFGSLAFMLVKASQTLYEIYKAYKERKSKHKIQLSLQTPDRLAKSRDVTPQEADSKPRTIDDSSHKKATIIEPINFESDQTTLKPLDFSNESFIMRKETAAFSQRTPKFEILQSSLDNPQDLNNQTQEDILLSNAHQNLEKSSFSNEDDAKVEALRAILAKNEETRRMREFQARLNRARSTRKVSHDTALFQLGANDQQQS